MTRIVPGSEMAHEAIERLREWDFRMDPDKVEPLLFTAWLRAFAHDVFFRRLGEAAADYWDVQTADHGDGADRASGMVRREL